MGDENQHVVVAKSGPRRRVANPVAISASGVQIPAATSITSVQKYEKMSTKEEPTKTKEIKYFVRIKNFDLDGTKSTERALLSLPGIGRRIAGIIINQAGLNPKDTLGLLDDDSIDMLTAKIEEFPAGIPAWATNRQNDFFTGEDRHLIGTDVDLVHQQDLNRMKKIGSYRGLRHRESLKVRGQRTKSTGRKGAKVGVSVKNMGGK